MAGRIIQVEERVPLLKGIPLSIQHTFAMFSASVLVPWLFGINAAIVLLMNGIGTLIFIVITKGKSPAYLGSSFAFISPTLLLISNPDFGYPYALGGFVVTGLIFCAVAILIKFAGTKWIDTVLPPAAMGPVGARIGRNGRTKRRTCTERDVHRNQPPVCRRFCGDNCRCRAGTSAVPWLRRRHIDSDRHRFGLPCRVLRRAGRLFGSDAGRAVCMAKFRVPPIQSGSDLYHYSGFFGGDLRTYRTSGRDE